MAQFMLADRSQRASLRTLDVRPDDTDARDYPFRPSLTLLPKIEPATPHHGTFLPARK